MVEVDRGRRAYAGEAWLEAYEQLSAADRREPLCVQDVGLLATAAYMIGRESEYLVLGKAMPNVSRETAAERIAFEGIDVRLEHLDGGYTVCFESHTADGDLAALFQGLPDDRAQLPRFGYVVQGRTGFRFPDREETYEAGDATTFRRGIRRSTTRAPRSSSSAPRTSSARRSPSS